MRLLESSTGWWAVMDVGGHVVKLPPEAATRVPAVERAGAWIGDHDRGVRLGSDAVAAMQEAGLHLSSSPSEGEPAKAAGSAYAVTVLTATSCNLGCNYCFQNTAMAQAGSFAPPRIKAARLGAGDVDAIASFVAEQQRRHGKMESTLLIFGGEPLLNKVGTLQLLKAFNSLGLIDAEIVTNGVLLSGVLAGRLHAQGLNRVQITFDGGKAEHDVTRVTRNGGATYDRIISNVIQSMAEAPALTWNFRVNVSHRNAQGLHALVDDLSDARQSGVEASLHLALIDDTGLGYDNRVGYDEDLASLFSEVYRRAVDRGLRVHPSPAVMDCVYCGEVGGATGAVINADGGLYSCWENAGRDGWSVGDVRQGYIRGAALKERWVDCEFDAASHGDLEANRAFHDAIDVSVLEHQYAQGALRASARP